MQKRHNSIVRISCTNPSIWRTFGRWANLYLSIILHIVWYHLRLMSVTWVLVFFNDSQMSSKFLGCYFPYITIETIGIICSQCLSRYHPKVMLLDVWGINSASERYISFCKISQIHRALDIDVFQVVQSAWNLTGISAALLLIYLPNFRVILPYELSLNTFPKSFKH